MKRLIVILLLFNVFNIYSQNQQGTEFYITFLPAQVPPPLLEEENLLLYITSTVETLVRLEIKSIGYYEEKLTIPNDIIVFKFTPDIAQTYVKYPHHEPKPDAIYKGAAIHITSDDPISVNAYSRYYQSSDGFLALPVDMLDTEYIIASYYSFYDKNEKNPSQVAIVAAFDNTKVSFKLGGNEFTSTSYINEPGKNQTKILNQGDVWLISSRGNYSDLSGSKINSDKPIAVISGNYCARVPYEVQACDFLTEMELSTSHWSTEMIVPNLHKRKYGSILKIFAKEENTTVYINDEIVGVIEESGGVENVGFLNLRTNPNENVPVIVRADKPIGVTLFNTGQGEDDVFTDPFQMIIPPFELFQTRILFSTPGIRKQIDGMDDNYLALVFSSDDGLIPDHIKFGFNINDEFIFKPLNKVFDNSLIKYAGIVQDKHYYVKTLILPSEGLYSLTADEPFMCYSYGYSKFDSYGFPSSLTILPSYRSKIEVLINQPQYLICEDYIDNYKEIVNRGNANLIISEINIQGLNADEFKVLDELPIIIEPNKSHELTIRFKPLSYGNGDAELVIISNSEPDSVITIPISAYKESIDFKTDISNIDIGLLKYNVNSTKSFKLQNKGTIGCTYILSSGPNIKIEPKKVYIQAQDEASINVYFDGSGSDFTLNEQIFVTDSICRNTKLLGVTGRVSETFMEIAILENSAEAGAITEIDIILLKQHNLEISNITSINFELIFNSTILFPLEYTPEKINEFNSKITIENIPIKYKEGEILAKIKFRVGLGNEEESILSLSNGSTQGGEADFYYKNGKFKLLGICYEGESPRLLNPNSQAGILNIIPNPANEQIQIDFSLIEKGFTEIKILNYLGETVKTIFSENVSNYEQQSILVDLHNLATGQYLIVFKTPTIIENRNLSVIR